MRRLARAAPSPDAPPRRSITTGWRLLLASAALVCAFVAALAVALSGLNHIDGALDRMRVHEERTQLALALESTIRDLYAHEAHIVLGDRSQIADYRAAQAWVDALEAKLAKGADDAEESRWIQEADRAEAELQAIFDRRIGEGRDRATTREDQALVSFIEGRLDAVATRHHDATVRLRDTVSALERKTLRWILALFLTACLFTAGVGLYVRRSVARPMARLGEGAARLARGDLDARIAVERNDEFGALAAQFNDMAASLKRHQAELVENERLASVGRLAAGVAHEINNPLTVILGYLMLHRRKAQGKLAKDLLTVEREAVRCKEIVQDLLEVSRPDAPRDVVAVDMRELCDEVVAALRGSDQLGACDVAVEGAGVASGNRNKLRQVLLNLVKNAAEATAHGGAVRVGVVASADGVEVTVRDSGAGVSPEARARIFEPFFTTKATGTGLGLAVSRAIARAHGGTLELRDDRQGAVFALRLPRAIAAEHACAVEA